MNDTIVAISTALGVGAISIIRVSGKDSIKNVNKIFLGKSLEQVESHTINYGYIIDNKEKIDEVLVTIMKAPRTFTTDDVVEINCHGGIITTNKILELLLLNGCRLALPGEFTKRAYLNGRIDLIEAESIMDIINTKSDKARKLAMSGLQGNLSKLITDLRKDLLDTIASIEVNIDYPEYQDIEEMTIEKIKLSMKNIKTKLTKLVNESANGKIIKDGINTVIIGRPNVGKSSILNKLLDEEKAIVTNIEGTTRDIVEGTITINGVNLNIIDTAGIRETNNIIEKIGVEKSILLIKKADLVLAIFNNNEKLTDNDYEIIEKIKNKKSIIVINKNDLESKINIERINNNNIVYTNTKTIDGVDSLKNKIKEMFNLEQLDNSDYTYLSNARQIALIKEANKVLLEVENALNNNVPIDMIEIDMKNIWNILGEINGESYDEELMDKLFSKFCLGK